MIQAAFFAVEDTAVENERAARLEISATQPLYGKKVRLSEGEAGTLEEEVLKYFGLRWIDFSWTQGIGAASPAFY